MTLETTEQRQARIRRWSGNREKCRRCGCLRINVRHEPDPEHSPEGMEYFGAFLSELHEFVPSGEFEPQMALT